MPQQFLAQLDLFRRNAIPDDEAGRGAAASMQDRKFPGAIVEAGNVMDRGGGCVVDDTLLTAGVRAG